MKSKCIRFLDSNESIERFYGKVIVFMTQASSFIISIASLLAFSVSGSSPSRADDFEDLNPNGNIAAINLAKSTEQRAVLEGQEMVFLTVDKTKLQAQLRTRPEHFSDIKVLHNFRIAIGKEKGDKQKIGDNRTPEGIYMTQEIIDDADLPPKYGPKAIPLDYPNPLDKVAGKTGYGIWLHGVIEDKRVEEANVTEGCVAFYNADIIKLVEWLKPHQGVVIIANDVNDVNRPDDVAAVERETRAWVDDWANRDIDRYLSHYAPDFIGSGRNLQQYKAYKQSVFKSYKTMSLKIDKARVLTHPKYAVTFMDQDFYGDKRFKSIGRKILYWQKFDDGKWMISREIFEDRRFEFINLATAEASLKNRPSQAAQNIDPETPDSKL